MSTMAFVVEQAPLGMGYALYSVGMKDNMLDKQPIAFCTSLVEVTMHRARLEKDAFGAEALPPEKIIEREVARYVPMPPQAQPPGFDPAQHNGTYPHIPLDDRPAVLHKMEYPDQSQDPEGGLLDKISKGMRGRTNAFVWFAILTVGYMAQRMA